jgi:hypothetical protein
MGLFSIFCFATGRLGGNARLVTSPAEPEGRGDDEFPRPFPRNKTNGLKRDFCLAVAARQTAFRYVAALDCFARSNPHSRARLARNDGQE